MIEVIIRVGGGDEYYVRVEDIGDNLAAPHALNCRYSLSPTYSKTYKPVVGVVKDFDSSHGWEGLLATVLQDVLYKKLLLSCPPPIHISPTNRWQPNCVYRGPGSGD